MAGFSGLLPLAKAGTL